MRSSRPVRGSAWALAGSLVFLVCGAARGAGAERIDLLGDARWEFRVEIEKELSPWGDAAVLRAGKTARIFARKRFVVEAPSRFAALEAFGSHKGYLWLNGKRLEGPVKGMRYERIPAIDPGLLREGENVFQKTWSLRGKEDGEVRPEVNARLFGLPPEALDIQTGPILGYASPRVFTVTCRTNMVARAWLHVGERTLASRPGLLHAWTVSGLDPSTPYVYFIEIARDGHPFTRRTAKRTVRTLPASGRFEFAVLGDSRTFPETWGKVARAVQEARPVCSVFVGDMVTDGRNDWEWDLDYFRPAKAYFATVPYFAVIGNHEHDAPIFTRLFRTPGGGKRWKLAFNGVLFIGIDGNEDWTAGSANLRWLEKTLASSEARFIFLFSHYPPWSSGGHGRSGRDGRPRERSVRMARETLLPLISRHGVTALFAGHDHFYERSEPGGTTVVVTGGAGAPLYPALPFGKKQNPHSKVCESDYHYCILTVGDAICTLRARNLEGELIDTRIWKAREGSTRQH